MTKGNKQRRRNAILIKMKTRCIIGIIIELYIGITVSDNIITFIIPII